MVLRDLSFWGILKLTLIIEFLAPLILTSMAILLLLVSGADFELGTGKVTFSGFDIYALKVQTPPDFVPSIPVSIFAVALGLMLLLIQCVVLHLIFQKTRFGNVRIGG